MAAHTMLGLLPQTLFLSVNILDRFCCRQKIDGETSYKFVGCAALWIASKYIEEKERVPRLQLLMRFVPYGYYQDEQMFMRLEMYVLNILEWRVNHPTPHCFIQLLEVDVNDGTRVRESATNVCKAKLVEYEFVGTRPSIMARDCLALASNGSLNAVNPI